MRSRGHLRAIDLDLVRIAAAWPAAEPPAGFADRVLAAVEASAGLRPAPADRDRESLSSASGGPMTWVVAAALVLAFVGLPLLLRPHERAHAAAPVGVAAVMASDLGVQQD
jgi:hypothetical protein